MSRHPVLGKYTGGELAEVGAVFTECMGLKHVEHGRSGALDEGDTREQCRAQVEQENWVLWRSDTRLFATTVSNSGRITPRILGLLFRFSGLTFFGLRRIKRSRAY